MLLHGLPSSQQDHSEGFVPAAMPQRFNGPTGKCKVLHDIGSLQWLLVVPYSRGRCTKDSIPNPVWAIQMGRDANGTDKCTSNVHADDEQSVRGHAGSRSSSLSWWHVNIQYHIRRTFQIIRKSVCAPTKIRILLQIEEVQLPTMDHHLPRIWHLPRRTTN